MTRIIQVSPESELAAKITRRTNNQNGITPRDLQSNSVIQSRLQNEFAAAYPDVFYRIKRGEESSASRIIENELAARILLAFDRKEPWTCHQTYKLFDELHADIFGRPEVNASRILALFAIYELTERMIPKIKDQPFANYSITVFFLVYLIREALETSNAGKKFYQTPSAFLEQENGYARLLYCIERILNVLIVDLNSELKLREENGTPLELPRLSGQ